MGTETSTVTPLTEEEAKAVIAEGEEVYCVYGPHRTPYLYDSYTVAWWHADALSTRFNRTFHVYNWETRVIVI